MASHDDHDLSAATEIPATPTRQETPCEWQAEQVHGSKKTSPVWHFIHRLVNGPVKNDNGKATEYICMLCVKKKKPWKSCLVMLSNHNPANGMSHLKSRHDLAYQEYLEQSSPKDKLLEGSKTPAATSGIQSMLSKGNSSHLDKVHTHLASVIVSHGLPLSFSQSQDVTALLQAATELKAFTYEKLSKGRQNLLLGSMFSAYIAKVKTLIVRAKAVFMPSDVDIEACSAANVRVPGWATLMYDGWDAIDKSFFGVSLSFILPGEWINWKIPIGLAQPSSHSAEDCAAAALIVCKRVGVYQCDLQDSCNDTTNSSVATGRILTGRNGSCSMHVSSLLIEHAIGKRVRTRNRKVVDSFDKHETLRKKHQACVKYIWSKRAKARRKMYIARNEAASLSTIRVQLDNDTRVAGTHRLFQQQLRSRYCQRVFFAQESDSVRSSTAITDEEWELTAQLEAVVRGAVELNFTCQVDLRPTISSAWLYVVRARASISTNNSYDVVDLTEQVHDDHAENHVSSGWGAGTSFKSLPKRKLSTEELLEDAKLLRQRLQSEFNTYLQDPEDNNLRAMILDPVMMTAGHPFLLRFGPTHHMHWQRGRTLLLDDMEADITLHRYISSSRNDTSDNSDQEDQSRAGAANDFVEPSILGTSDDFFSSVMGNSSDEYGGGQAQQPDCMDLQTPRTIAEQAGLNRWETMTVDWPQFLREHQPDVEFDLHGVRQNNPYVLVEVVDTLKWWKVTEKLYPWIARTAARRLAKPSANSLQERVFSFLKRLDTPLRQRLGHDKFEMIALLGFNMKFIMSSAGMDCFKTVINSLQSATSPPAAAERIREFFDLDENDKDGDGSESLESMLKDFLLAGPSKKR